MTEKPTKQKVLIVGGGFGGIKAALELANNPNFSTTLLSESDTFRYYPTLYNVALGKSSSSANIDLAEIFEGKNINIVKATAKSIDRMAKTIVDTKGKKHNYDHLIIALGVMTNFFGIKGLDKYSYGIKSLEEAQRLRNHLHKQLIDKKKPDLNYVIIGGGPTGVELAGALPHYIHQIMKLHGLRDRKIHVDLVEAAPRLTPRMPKTYSRALQKRLRKLGVKLYLNETVKAQNENSLQMSKHSLDSHTVIWTAGVTNHSFFKNNGFKLNDRGKVLVNEYLEAEPNIYIIGDNADTPYSGMAQTALFDGNFVAHNLIKQAEGEKIQTYKAKKPVYVIPAGPYWAAVLWGKIPIYGSMGWALREAADFKGFSDYEPWWKASTHWLAQEDEEESCVICAPANS